MQVKKVSAAQEARNNAVRTRKITYMHNNVKKAMFVQATLAQAQDCFDWEINSFNNCKLISIRCV